jgi:dTDP-3-amino-3,4,6-trideoxy-alpha-D-glucose transaminase
MVPIQSRLTIYGRESSFYAVSMAGVATVSTEWVPFVDLSATHDDLKAAMLADIAELIDSGSFTNGPHVAEFENAFAAYCGTKYCVGVASGLDALRLALIAAGLEPGDEVIVPALTFVATFEAVTQAGGVPVAVDVSETDYCINPAAAEAAIGPRTRFLLPVHLYGQMANMPALERVARRHSLQILEDASQAHGAERAGFRAGAGGFAGAFSFYPSKNLGAMGDAGAVTTDDPVIAREIRVLREHGQETKYEHRREGWTSRLDTIQALVLLHKLPMLDSLNAQRRAAAALYLDALSDVVDITPPPVPAGSNPVWHLFVIQTSSPTELADHLFERGIQTKRHYPVPPAISEAYDGYGFGHFEGAERVARECLSLPLFPGMTKAQLELTIESVIDFF